ncbi:insulin-like growth factor-binding protein 3 [Hippocampus zosterae]|uniref:insulin-like growth factor-binding protein 3 n=1 Tax=Hippocampus zosterae TaxID=109293 RepID=UPI00223C99B6|nr:insulin-like growth factor-binding protein 3 [Hippocampus zosterae]
MPPLRNSASVVFILIVLGAARTGARRSGPFKVCPGCGDPPAAARPPGEREPAQGEPCGVYTLSCAKGLRCVPPPGERSPLQALLRGRGLCVKQIRTGPTERPHPTGPHPSRSSDSEKAPCRKLLNSVLRGLQLTIIQSHRDIYIPNCDTRGFYRQKQCRSSKGTQRGHCWCVDEAGAPVPSLTGEDAVPPCEGE